MNRNPLDSHTSAYVATAVILESLTTCDKVYMPIFRLDHTKCSRWNAVIKDIKVAEIADRNK